jgi:hypothetical protein
MTLKDALLRCFKDEPNDIFGIQDLCSKVQKYYTFSNFQSERDPKHPQRRYEHEIRSRVNSLKKEHFLVRLGRNQYTLA